MGLRPQLFFDARMIGHSGIGTQVENVLSRLLARDETNLTILGNSGKVKTILGDVRVPVVEWDAPIYSIQEQLQYPAIPPGALLHFPHYNAPVTRMQQSVVVLHDLIHLQSAEFNRIQKVYCRFFLGRLARNARSVVTVSDATRNEFLKLHPGAAGRTETILNGLDHKRFRPPTPAAVIAFRRKYGLPKEFLLTVGIGKRHKNVDFVVRSLSPFWTRGDLKVPLVMAGTGGVLPDHVHEEILRARVGGHIIVLPRVEAHELPILYGAASVFIMPSMLEGFGFPLLEAMACGAPALSSNAASLPEVGGGAPAYFDPTNESDFVDNVMTLVSSKEARKKASTKGVKQAKSFSWDKHVDALMDVYRKVKLS